MSEELSTDWAKQERPGCVTAYAILLWIGSGLGLIGALCMITSMSSAGGFGLGTFEIGLAGVMMVLLAINAVTGYGLWQMKKWGWALVVVIQGLNLALQLFSMCLTLFGQAGPGGEFVAGEPSVLCGNLAGTLIGGFILYWFVTNRELFNGGPVHGTVAGGAGSRPAAARQRFDTQTGRRLDELDGAMRSEPRPKKTSDTTMILAVGGGLVLVCILVSVVVIAMLALMGPQVGNVFSQITFDLENPTTGLIPLLW